MYIISLIFHLYSTHPLGLSNAFVQASHVSLDFTFRSNIVAFLLLNSKMGDYPMGRYNQIPEQNDAEEPSTNDLPVEPRLETQERRLPASASASAIRGLLWWLITLLLNAFIVVTVNIYHKRDRFPAHQKHTFNIISTGLILGLGLNFFVSSCPFATSSQSIGTDSLELKEVFKGVAKASGPRLRMDGLENLTHVVVLAFKARNEIAVVSCCVGWVSPYLYWAFQLWHTERSRLMLLIWWAHDSCLMLRDLLAEAFLYDLTSCGLSVLEDTGESHFCHADSYIRSSSTW